MSFVAKALSSFFARNLRFCVRPLPEMGHSAKRPIVGADRGPAAAGGGRRHGPAGAGGAHRGKGCGGRGAGAPFPLAPEVTRRV